VDLTRPTPPPFDWAQDLFTVGVTGTNGKTSTVHLIAAALAATGDPVLTVGTVGYYLDGVDLQLPRTLSSFHRAFEGLVKRGGRYGAVEVTSKALKEGFAKRWRFDLAVFTNLSPDHYQTHGSWEHYLASKAQLFVHLAPGATAVLNASDPHSMFLDQAIPGDVQRLWYGSPSRGDPQIPPDLLAAEIEVGAGGTRVELAPSELADALGGQLHVNMVGDVFAENAMAAAAAAVRAGVEPELVVKGLGECPPVPGRFEVVHREPTVVVDYAHTPDALGRTLDTARACARGRVLLVFGAGGESSPDKRGPMGEIAGRKADRVFVTNDNPRREDPKQIADMLVSGIRKTSTSKPQIVFDRARAIEMAIGESEPEDIVVIAGKGHERGQHVGETVEPFSDRDEVLRVVGSDR
jgi:UDP-N-acetylmuramoyl-L-alanyl-D-glutamate--2,6-diaminopimelate ligase